MNGVRLTSTARFSGATPYRTTPASRRDSGRKRTVSTATSAPLRIRTRMRRVSTDRRMSSSR